MAQDSFSATTKILLNSKILQPPKEWQEIGLIASFQDGEVQPTITQENLTFILDSYTELKNWIADGNVFEGMPLTILSQSTNQNGLSSITSFDGFVDLRDAIINDTEGSISAEVRYKEDISRFFERLQALDYAYLDLQNAINYNYSDCDYTVVKIDYAFEALMQSTILFLMTKQLIEVTRIIADNIATIAGLTTAALTGAIGATVYLIATLILNVVYATAILIQVINLGRDLISAFVQPKRTHKSSDLFNLIKSVCNYLGYSFNTSILDMKNYYYLPSNTNVDEFDDKIGFLKKAQTIKKGIPNVLDYGYRCSEMFELVRNMFNGRFAIVDNTVQFHTELSPFWQTFSTFQMPDILEGEYKYNTEELKSNIFISFETDLTDGWTIEKFEGTNYQIITTDITNINPKAVVIDKLEEVRLPVALGVRKDKLNGFEKFLKFLAGIIDGVVNTFNRIFFLRGRSDLAGRIQNKVGILKVENNNHRVPKIILLENGRIPSNHRQRLSAKHLWENYISEKSFIQNGFRRQRKLFSGVSIPFGWQDYVKLINNSYFTDLNGKQGKVTEIEWIQDADTANISYYLEEVYTTNLKETFIEPK